MALALVFCSALSMAASAGANESPQQQDTRRFTYSWQFHSDSELAPVSYTHLTLPTKA